jgi:hypothetical protein
MRLSVQRLEKLGDPPSLIDLRKRVAAMLPIVDLPEVLMDVHSWTGMLDAYTHVGGLNTSMDQLPVTVAALLVADACNVGLVPVTRPGDEALSRDRLSHVTRTTCAPTRTPPPTPGWWTTRPTSASPTCGAAAWSPPSTAYGSGYRCRPSRPAPAPGSSATNAASPG